ncbi:hypothetical protein [Psychrobacillus sp. FSL H8-0510]
MEKLTQLSKLNSGDKVKLHDGSIAEFVRLKQKNFIGLIEGTSYNISVESFVEVLEKIDIEAKNRELQEEFMKLVKDDYFYISLKGEAILYQFDTIKNGKIIGINPVTKSLTRIAPSLFGGKISI